MVLESVRVYWLPIASKALGVVTADEALRKLAYQSVSALCSRARYLCSNFDLDPAAFGLSASGVVVSGFPVQAVPSVPSVGSPNVPALGSVQALVPSVSAIQDELESDESDEDDFNEDEVEGFGLYAASADLRFNAAGL
jgi:hypothetical protein